MCSRQKKGIARRNATVIVLNFTWHTKLRLMSCFFHTEPMELPITVTFVFYRETLLRYECTNIAYLILKVS